MCIRDRFSHRANLEPFGLRHVRSERDVVGQRTVEVRHVPWLLGVRPRLAELPTPLSIVESGPDVVEELPARLELAFDRGQGRDWIDRHAVSYTHLTLPTSDL